MKQTVVRRLHQSHFLIFVCEFVHLYDKSTANCAKPPTCYDLGAEISSKVQSDGMKTIRTVLALSSSTGVGLQLQIL